MLKRNLILISILLLALANPASAIKYKGDLEANESITFPEQGSKPTSPASTKHKLYFDDEGAALSLDSSGRITPLTKGGFKNRVINGNFDLWQRGTSFTGKTANLYTADRWLILPGTGGTIDATRQDFTEGQTDVPGNPKYFMRIDITTTGSGSTEFRAKLEDVAWGAGLPVTVSFYAKGSVARTLTAVRFAQNFGTGGSSEVITNLGSKSITTSWQKITITFTAPSISTKTIGTARTHYLWFNAYWDNSVTGSVDLARFQMELGGAATDFEERPIAVELAMAQRYYFKTYAMATSPGVTTSTGAVTVGVDGMNSAVHHIRLFYEHPVAMRVPPTVTLYSQNGNSGQWADTGGTDRAASALGGSDENATMIEVTTASGADSRVRGHVVGDADF